VSVPSRYEGWFRAFPEDYRWSAAVALLLGSAPYGGAELGEVERVVRSLRGAIGNDDAWFDAWRALGEQLADGAEAAQAAGHRLTAGSVALRAAAALQIGERFRLPKDEAAADASARALECFGRFAEVAPDLVGATVEAVDVPYEGPAGPSGLPAWLVLPRARPAGPGPLLVCFDGLDVTKELVYLRGIQELVRRGVGALLVDGPGTGEAIRRRGLTLVPDYERAGSACLAWLASRPEVDLGRVGVMALSLGGYYATRCAARAPGFACCVAWGAIWDYQATWRARVAAGFQRAMSVAGEHLAWVLGASDTESALEQLTGFQLAGVAEEVRCPFLLLHGTRDEQVPLADAHALFDAVGARDKTFEIFDEVRGGATHCQNDQLTAATVVIADWVAERLGGAASGPNEGSEA
jgi:dienelactone hydrolase